MSSPFTTPSLVVRGALATSAWLRTRVFVVPPVGWRLLGGIAFGLSVLFVVAAWPAALLAAAAAAGSIQPVLTWRRLQASSTKPTIVLARFANSNPAYEEIATVHIQEVERRLRRNSLLTANAEIRVIDVPVELDHAYRLLRHCPISGVLSGRGLAVGESVRWEGWALLRSPGSWFRSVQSSGRDPWIIDRQVGIDKAEEMRLKSDAEVPTSKLTSEIFSAEHALALEGLLLAHVAAWTADANPASEDLCSAAEGTGANLPLSAQAQLAATRVRLRLAQDGDVRKAVADLKTLGDGGLSHWRIWDYCFTLMLEDMEGFSAADRLRVAERGVGASPDHALALANLGATLLVLNRREEARAPLAKALELSSGDDPAHFYPAVMSNAFAAGGNRDDWLRWKRNFRRVLRRDRPGLLAQLRLTKGDLRGDALPGNFGTWGFDE
jgi:hypothetical protein